jgi:Flp pilus assembly protein TadG
VSRGQALVELAVCAPLLLLLTLGAVATVQVIDARAGLAAATQAAAAEAARAPDLASAEIAARTCFDSMVANYPLRSPSMSISIARFSRTDEVVVSATSAVDISWASLVFPSRLTLAVRAAVPLESWRSHRQPL